MKRTHPSFQCRFLCYCILLRVGGAVGMAEVCKTSGLTDRIGAQFANIDFLSPGLLLLLMTTMTAFLTEIASNAATASVVLPIMNSMVTFCIYNTHAKKKRMPSTSFRKNRTFRPKTAFEDISFKLEFEAGVKF